MTVLRLVNVRRKLPYFFSRDHYHSRDYYDQVTWCFCEFDNFCNGGSDISRLTTAAITATAVIIQALLH